MFTRPCTRRAALVVASSAVALSLTAAAASAQVQYVLQKADSINLGASFNATSGYGNNPLSVAVDNAGNAYVGGNNNTSLRANVGIVKIGGALSGAPSIAGLASTQFMANPTRGLDALSSFGGDIVALHDAGGEITDANSVTTGGNRDAFVERLNGSGAVVWQTFNPGNLPLTSSGLRVSAMAVDPGYVAGGAPIPQVGMTAFGQGRIAALDIGTGLITERFSQSRDADTASPGNRGPIINAKPGIVGTGSISSTSHRALAFDSQGNVATGLDGGFGAGKRVGGLGTTSPDGITTVGNDTAFSTLDGSAVSSTGATSNVVQKSAYVNNIGNGITYLQGAATDELIAFSARSDGTGAGVTTTLTANDGSTTTVPTSNVQIRRKLGNVGYLSQTQLTGAEDGLGSTYGGEIKNFATGVDASGNPALYVIDFSTKQLDVYTIEPRYVATTNANWSSPATWTLGIIPDSRTTNATFVDAAAPRTVTLDSNRTVKQLKFGGANPFTIVGTSTLNLTAPANDNSFAYVSVLSGSHSFTAPIVLGSNTRIDVTGAASSITLGNVDGVAQTLVKRLDGTANVTHVRVNTLSIDQGTLALSPNGSEAGISRVTALTLGTTPTTGSPTVGKLALTNNGLIFDYDPTTGTSQASNFTAALSAGIVTTTAVDANHTVGIIDYTDSPTAALPTFSSPGLTIDRSSTFIRYVFKGDSNLSGTVDFADLLTLAKAYNTQTGATFAGGDTDGNGTVDFADLLTLAKNYNKSVATNGAAADEAVFKSDWALAQSLVPEPTTLLGLGGVALSLARRRRA